LVIDTQGVTAVLKVLKASYPNFYKDLKKEDAEEILSLWGNMFSDDDTRIVIEAVKALIATHRYPPTIADVKEKIFEITHPKSLSELEAWNLVRKAIRIYDTQQYFEELPPIIQRVVGSASQLREWACMDAEVVNSVIQSNFMRSYKSSVKNDENYEKLPSSTKEMIGMLSEKMKMISGGNDE
jgi:hypothetical protein